MPKPNRQSSESSPPGWIVQPGLPTAVCSPSGSRATRRPPAIGAHELIQQPGPVFSGFLAPVSNPPAVNTVKAGQAVPVKFRLGGDWGLNIVAPGYPASRQVTCPLSSGAGTLIDTVTADDSSLTYDSTTQTYTYVWKTDGARHPLRSWFGNSWMTHKREVGGQGSSADPNFPLATIRPLVPVNTALLGSNGLILPL